MPDAGRRQWECLREGGATGRPDDHGPRKDLWVLAGISRRPRWHPTPG